MDDEIISIRPSPTKRNSLTNAQQQTSLTLNRYDTEPVTDTISIVDPLDSRRGYQLNDNRVALFLAFFIFASISLVVGVTTVYFTLQNHTNQTCQFIFKRSAQQISQYDSRPYHLTVGDVNQDSHLDIIVANSGTNTIGIFLGYGNATFASQTLFSTGLESHPNSVAVGDFNNDTLLDIVVANYGINSIGVLLGHGNGSFTTPILTSTGSSRPVSLATGDFNNDNILDIAVVNYGVFSVAILVGLNNGSFRIETTYDMGYDSIPYSPLVVDFNQDNQLDIAVVNYGTSELVIILRHENGSFIIDKYSTGDDSHPSALAIGDVNNDNTSDIVVANSGAGNVGVFLGNGSRYGTFMNLKTFSTGSDSHPQGIVLGNFYNDTQLDIISIDRNSNDIVLLKGNGHGSFSLEITYSTGYNSDPYAIVINDFDKDNKSDVVIANNGTNNILILSSFSFYTVTHQVEYSTGVYSEPYYVDAADFNKDGHLDIAVPNYGTNNVGIFINLGNGTFANQTTYYMGTRSWPYYSAIGDLDNDNHLDIAVPLKGTSQIGILHGYGNGTFRIGNKYSTGAASEPYSIALGDFNNDSNLDIVISNYNSGNVGIYFGFGNGTFTAMRKLLDKIYFYPKCVNVADFNQDNLLDIIASDSWTGGIAILLGYGNGSFQQPIFISTQDDLPNSFTIGDVNGDLQLDIVYTDTIYSHIGVLLGIGNGTFVNLTQYVNVRASKPWYVDLGYYNDDDLIDIAASSAYDSSISIFLGTKNRSFELSTSLPTGYGSWPWSVMFGDFDNDNRQDLVAANDKTNNIQIFFVNSNGMFTKEISYTTGSGSHPYSVSVGNFNNNEQLDIVVANSGNDNIELLLDYNNNTFMNRTIFSTGSGSHPQSVTIADFNKDHLLDIAVVSSWTNNINIFLGDDGGFFDIQYIFSTGSGSYPNSIALGDFNRDRRVDIVIANQDTDNVVVFLAFDYVTFTNNIVLVPGNLPNPYYVALGDFNNDGILDLAVINDGAYNIGIYFGYGNGTFSEQISLYTGYSSNPATLAIDDLNNDGVLDIVVANYRANNIGVFQGYGNGSFQSYGEYSTGASSYPISVATGDFNSDSRCDIVVANYYADNLYIFLGYGNGSFAEKIIYSMSIRSYPTWVTVNDLNYDRILDIVVANYNADNVCILLGYGNGSFGNVITLPTGYYSGPYPICVGDFNNDKLLDVVVGNMRSKTVGIFFGYSNGSFSSQKIYSIGSNASLFSVAIGDMNNDQMLDILVIDFNRFNNSVGIFYGFGDGNFTVPTIYPTGMNSEPTSIAIGDFNNDSRIDLAIVYYNKASVGILLQLRREPIASSVLFPTGSGSQPKSVTIGDFNNDDNLDIAVANSGTNNIGILLGYGNGYFTAQVTHSTGDNSLPSSITVGYFNNDDCLDIAVINSATYKILILFGLGNGTFVNATTYSTDIGSDPSSIVVGDLNKDNHTDLVVANFGTSNILIFHGSSDGTFHEPKSYSVGYNARPQSLAIGYINNDNLLDIVVANYGTDYVEILLQSC